MKEFVKSIFPDFPDDRNVLATTNNDRMFRVDWDSRTLYVPTKRLLQSSPRWIQQFVEAVRGFMSMDLTNPTDWSKIHYEEDNGNEEEALRIIERIKQDIMDNAQADDPFPVSVDIETKHVALLNNKVLAIGFCSDSKNELARIITVFTPAVIKALQKLFSMSSDQVHFTLHNGQFDGTRCKWLLDLRVRVDEDTMLLHYVGINEHQGTHALKDLSNIYLGAPHWEAELKDIQRTYCREHGIKLAEFGYDMFPKKVLHKYLAFDSVCTRRLLFKLREIARSNSAFIYGKLVEASNVYMQVELNGIEVDTDYLDDLEVELDREREAAEKRLNTEVAKIWDPIAFQRESGAKSFPKAFNMKSPQQLKWLLEKATGQTLPNTSKETLADLFETLEDDDDSVVTAISTLRKVNKNIDTYVQGIRTALSEDCRIHTSYKLHGTVTGRLASERPNMQNIPREKRIKNIFKAEDGYILIELDYSQAELRTLAYLSQDKSLIGIYERDEDIHAAVARDMHGPNFTPEDRQNAKAINFGIAYGRGPANLAKVLKLTFQQAKALLDGWMTSKPQAAEYIKRVRQYPLKGITPISYFGRERNLVNTGANLNALQNECINFGIQSLASDFTMFSLCEIQHWIEKENLACDVRIVATVHDSIILEVEDRPELVDMVITSGKTIMAEVPKRYVPDMNVPFKADSKVGYTWGSLKGD